MMDFTNWLKIMKAYGFDDNRGDCEKLIKAHGAKGRHYHTAEHISACLRHLETARHIVQDWKSIALAFWFHDAVYKPFSKTNERDSADWAIDFLSHNNASEAQISQIEALIKATCHNVPDLTGDAQVMIDIDLSILGAAPEIYNQYARNVRREYKRVPAFIFRKNRKALLEEFLHRDYIFGSTHFRDLWETQARENLSLEIKELS